MGDESFKEKLRSLSFQGRPATSKKVRHVTDTAVVTETHRNDGMDTHVRITEPTTIKRAPKEATT